MKHLLIVLACAAVSACTSTTNNHMIAPAAAPAIVNVNQAAPAPMVNNTTVVQERESGFGTALGIAAGAVAVGAMLASNM